jgi:hypothetical protein
VQCGQRVKNGGLEELMMGIDISSSPSSSSVFVCNFAAFECISSGRSFEKKVLKFRKKTEQAKVKIRAIESLLRKKVFFGNVIIFEKSNK